MEAPSPFCHAQSVEEEKSIYIYIFVSVPFTWQQWLWEECNPPPTSFLKSWKFLIVMEKREKATFCGSHRGVEIGCFFKKGLPVPLAGEQGADGPSCEHLKSLPQLRVKATYFPGALEPGRLCPLQNSSNGPSLLWNSSHAHTRTHTSNYINT